MIPDKNMEILFKKYEDWIENKSFTVEIAAFEYLKRNPFFIEVVLLFSEQIIEIRDNIEAKKELIFLLEHMQLVFQRLFLYTGIDIVNLHNVYTGGNTGINTASHLYAYSLKISNLSKEDNNYGYSNIYSIYSGKTFSDSSDSYKREHIVDIDMLLGDEHKERWLEHLKPVLYLKINPYHSQTRLKSDLVKTLNAIENEFPEYATSELVIDELGKFDSSLRSPTIQPVKSAIGLMLYDLQNIFHISDPEILKNLLEKRFPEKYFDLFHEYFSKNERSWDEETLFTTSYKRSLKEAKKRIYGDYLKYIYSEKAINTHINMIRKDYIEEIKITVPNIEVSEDMKLFVAKLKNNNSTDNSKKNILEFIEELKSKEKIKDRIEYLFLDVKSYSIEEYEDLSRNIFKNASKTVDEIFTVLLM